MPAKNSATASITQEDITALAGEIEQLYKGRVSIAIAPQRAKSGRPYWWLDAQLLRTSSTGKGQYPWASTTVMWPQWSYKTFYGCMYAALWDLLKACEAEADREGRATGRTIVLAALPDRPA